MATVLFRKGLVFIVIGLFIGFGLLQVNFIGNEIKDFVKMDYNQNCEIDMFSNQSGIFQKNSCISTYDTDPILISLQVCKDILTYSRQPTLFRWQAISPIDDHYTYECDFNGDEIIDFKGDGKGGQTMEAFYTYNKTGKYQAMIKVALPSGKYSDNKIINVAVEKGCGEQTYIEKDLPAPKTNTGIKADGNVEKYAVMINGGYEERFWIDVNFTYYMLTNDYGYNSENIYLLNYNGSNPYGENPNDMIDYSCTLTKIGDVFSNLSQIIDEDDILFIWIDDHGMGYIGPNALYSYFGFLYSYDAPFYDPGDEEDYIESDFKLRSFCVYGDFYEDIGMDIWKIQKRWNSPNNCYRCYREKYVSSFTDVYFENINNTASNNDVLIEIFVDYLEGDYDQDGYIETDEGEVYDNDGDGIWPFDNYTGEINDEDDWGEIHHYENVTYLNTGVPQNSSENYMIFDDGFDNHVDIDLHYTGGQLEVDGTDSDNQGLFDGIDINEDGDKDDWVSIDEQVCTFGEDLRDDILAIYLDNISAEAIPIFLEPCFCGGFIWDISKFNRVICTATVEEDVSWGNTFVRGFTSAFHGSDIYGNPVDADTNGDGDISFSEAFNYASVNDYTGEIPQYDDNGDGISHAFPIPNGSDGALGINTFLWGSEFIGTLDIINLSENWNFISLDSNQSASKSDLTIIYLWNLYNWSEAVSNGIINDHIFGWNRTSNGYNFANILEPGYGYWVYSYDDCELWIGNITLIPDDYITNLKNGWNIVGIPYNQSVNKTNILVNGIPWDDAVVTGTISNYVFGWSLTSQGYIFSDTFIPGNAYWIYAYQPCTLKRTT